MQKLFPSFYYIPCLFCLVLSLNTHQRLVAFQLSFSMKSWYFLSVLDAQVAEEDGEKTGRQSFQQFFGGHGILTTFIPSKRHIAGAHSCSMRCPPVKYFCWCNKYSPSSALAFINRARTNAKEAKPLLTYTSERRAKAGKIIQSVSQGSAWLRSTFHLPESKIGGYKALSNIFPCHTLRV